MNKIWIENKTLIFDFPSPKNAKNKMLSLGQSLLCDFNEPIFFTIHVKYNKKNHENR